MQPKTRAIAALDALGLAAVAALFVLWCAHTPDLTAAGGIAAGCSAALFAAVGLRFVPAWVRFWQREAASPAVPAQEPAHMAARIFAALLALDLALLLLTWGVRALAGGLVDEPQGLLKTFVLAEHHRGGLHHRHAAGVLQISHGSTSLQNDTMIIPDGHAGTQQVSAQDAASVVQRGEFRLHVQAVRAANSTHSTGSQDRFRLCIIRPVLSARHEKRRAEGVGKPLPPYGKQTADAAPT